MSLQAHLSELAAKHKTLESELADALAHPASTDQEIAELKRKKLRRLQMRMSNRGHLSRSLRDEAPLNEPKLVREQRLIRAVCLRPGFSLVGL